LASGKIGIKNEYQVIDARVSWLQLKYKSEKRILVQLFLNVTMSYPNQVINVVPKYKLWDRRIACKKNIKFFLGRAIRSSAD
jgi:hypothetical protein